MKEADSRLICLIASCSYLLLALGFSLKNNIVFTQSSTKWGASELTLLIQVSLPQWYLRDKTLLYLFLLACFQLRTPLGLSEHLCGSGLCSESNRPVHWKFPLRFQREGSLWAVRHRKMWYLKVLTICRLDPGWKVEKRINFSSKQKRMPRVACK